MTTGPSRVGLAATGRVEGPRPAAGGPERTAEPAAGRAGLTATAAGGPGPAAVPPAGRAGLTATATVAADRDAGRPRIRWTQAWPIVLRPTGNARVHLVHGAGGPLGGDVLALDVRVGAGAALAVRSAGATIVQPGRGSTPARWGFDVVVGAGGTLDWAPEPTVVTDGADYRTALRCDLGAGARVTLREVVVLGRHGGVGGRYRGRFDVSVDGDPLLAHTTSLDGADPALCGPGGTAGARAVGTLVVVDAAVPAAADDGSTTRDPTAGCPASGAAVGGVAAGSPASGGAVGAAAFAAGTGADGGGAAEAPADVGERPSVRWAWTELAGPGRALFAVGEPGAVIALLAAVTG